MKDKKYKVLFLASLYPSRLHPLSGIFIEKHAKAVSKFCDVAVLYVTSDKNLKDKTYDIEYKVENNIFTIRIYYKEASSIILAISNALRSIKYIRGIYQRLRNIIEDIKYINGAVKGLRIIKEDFGTPDIVHVNFALRAGLIALILKYLKGIPYIITEHWGGFTEDNLDKNCNIYDKLLIKVIFKNAEAITAVSQYLFNSLKKLGLIKNKQFITPNIVDNPQNIFMRKKSNARIKGLTISVIDNMEKNLSGVIKALKKVVYKYNNVELHIIGDGKDRKILETLAHNLGLLGKNIFFHGYVPNNELSKYFAKAHFFILNSNYETFSVATAEAIAHGVPVVVTKCGGPEDFVSEDVGIFVERQNEESLSKGIEYMVKNWHKYNPIRLHNYAIKKFSCEVVGKQFYEIYKIVSSKRKRAYIGK